MNNLNNNKPVFTAGQMTMFVNAIYGFTKPLIVRAKQKIRDSAGNENAIDSVEMSLEVIKRTPKLITILTKFVENVKNTNDIGTLRELETSLDNDLRKKFWPISSDMGAFKENVDAEDIENYSQNAGLICPYCKSWNVEREVVQGIDSNLNEEQCTCRSCGAAWVGEVTRNFMKPIRSPQYITIETPNEILVQIGDSLLSSETNE